MAYKDFDGLSLGGGQAQQGTVLQVQDERVALPDASYVRDAQISRQGMDLVLEGPDGTVTVEGYFAAQPAPILSAPDGTSLTPQLVQSFMHNNMNYAAQDSATDESPVGAVLEVTGHATVTRKNGAVETIASGTPIYEGDIIATDANGAVNIQFIDETTFAVSQDARLAIDEYVFDPATQTGENHFSVLKGLFVFTSGLIGRDDPDDVHIQTPMGSIGIRGTIIAGNATTGEITVIEGAIVLQDLQGHEITLASQFETARFGENGEGIEHIGQLDALSVADKFSAISIVSPNLFSSVNDAARDQGQGNGNQPQETAPAQPAPQQPQNNNGSGFQDNSGLGTAPAQPAPQPVTAPPSSPTGGNSAGPTQPAPLRPSVPDAPYVPQAPVETNLAPQSLRALNLAGFFLPPQAVFAAAENTSWSYDFSQEFRDVDGGALTYSVSAATRAMLDSTLGDGNWGINATTGALTFSNLPSLGGHWNFTIQITATDSAGLSTSHDYNFTAYDVTANSGSTPIDGDGGFYIRTGSSQLSVEGDDNVFFINADGHSVYLEGQDNTIYLKSGNNNVDIDALGTGNTVFGGNSDDIISIANVTGTKIYGMAGSDNFTLVLSAAGLINNLENVNSGFVVDGGNGSDTLSLQDAGSLDFRNLFAQNNQIRNIEVLDLKTSASVQTVILDYQSVLSMTDQDHTLKINLDNGDFLNFDAQGHNFTSNGTFTDTVSNITYNVYTDGTVTLLVDQAGNPANIIGLTG